LQIAFAEDLYLYYQANNINFPQLRDALNTKWNVEILEPREGIGGHCLPKDTKMFLQSSKFKKSKILAAAMEVDEDYRRYRGLWNAIISVTNINGKPILNHLLKL
jgi:UDP-N-acetyl-D-mannosaminuronic acid dehydrogenase